jgi:uncharacterized protein
MEMTGEQVIPATRAATWQALLDPASLQACVPGCESMEKVSDTEYALVMATAIGPVKARFKGKLTLANVDIERGYDIAFEGQGGVAGFAKGGARVDLADGHAPNETHLAYTVTASVGGKLAQIGSRLVDGAARKTAESFFQRFREFMSAKGSE